MLITVLKKSFQKAKPKIIQYRDYKKLDENNFVDQLHNSFEDRITSSYREFYNRFLNVFNSQVPIKKKTIKLDFHSSGFFLDRIGSDRISIHACAICTNLRSKSIQVWILKS